MTKTKPFTDRDGLLAWLATMDPLTRARIAGMLVDQPTIEAVGAVRRGAVWEATKQTSRPAVAAELGVSISAVHKACQAHTKAVNEKV